MVYPEMGSDDRRPMTWGYYHMKKEARTSLGWIVFKNGLNPATQKIAGQRVDASGGQSRWRCRIENDRSTNFTRFNELGMRRVKGFRRADSMSHLPDMKLCLAVESPHGQRQFAFVREQKVKDGLTSRSIIAQVTPIHSQQLRRHYWIKHFALYQSVHGPGSDCGSQNQWADSAGRGVTHPQ
jgi:hypothetical protein